MYALWTVKKNERKQQQYKLKKMLAKKFCSCNNKKVPDAGVIQW